MKCTLNSIPTRSSLSGTVSYETYIAGHEESGFIPQFEPKARKMLQARRSGTVEPL